jgi:hypothetical protein
MALTLRTGADGSIVSTNYHSFNPGDSILKSETLLGAIVECSELIVRAIRDYNQDNALLPFPEATLAWDDSTQTVTFETAVPYKKTGTVKTPVDYLNAYDGWDVPTTGELIGVTNLLGAYMYLVDAVVYGNEKLQPTLIIQSPADFVLFSDNNNDNQYATSYTLPYNSGVDSVTGVIEKIAQNYFIFLDMQELNPI